MKGSNKIEWILTGLENFVMCFCIPFDCYWQSFISGKESKQALCYVFTHGEDFPNI